MALFSSADTAPPPRAHHTTRRATLPRDLTNVPLPSGHCSRAGAKVNDARGAKAGISEGQSDLRLSGESPTPDMAPSRVTPSRDVARPGTQYNSGRPSAG